MELKRSNINKYSGIFIRLCLVMALMASCKLGPNYIRTIEQPPSEFRQEFPSDSTIANMPWWSLFGDTVLVNLIHDALINNKDLKISILRMNEAAAAIGIVRADLYPRINYSFDGKSSLNTEKSAVINDYVGNINVSYTVDIWGQVRRLNEAALQDYLASEQAYRGLTIMLVATMANAYLTLRDLDNRLMISEQTAESWKSNLEIVKARYNGGFVSEVDLNQAKIQLLEAETAIQTFTRMRIQVENAISILAGKPPQAIPRGLALQEQILPPDLPSGLPSELLDRRPDLLQAESQLHAQTARIGAAEALKYPSITLTADMGFAFADPAYLFAALGGQVLGPVFNSQANNKRVEIEKLKAEEMLNNYEQVYLNALKEVEDAMISVISYKKEFELRYEQMLASQEAVRLSWVRYEGGLTSYLEVLDLQRSSFSSQLNASETLQLQITSIVNLYQALGGGWIPGQDTLMMKIRTN